MTGCPSADALIEYCENSDAHPEIETHIRVCSNCTGVAAILGRLQRLDLAGEIDEYLDELEALMAEIVGQPRHRWPLLLADPRFHRLDLARRLLMAGVDARWKDPRLAVDLTKAAARITDALPAEDGEIAEVRFEVWKIHSAWLRESGRYEDCRAALARAAEAATHVRDVELADTAVLFSHALLAIEPDIWQPEQAAALLDIVEGIYARRDRERWLRARTARGILLYRLGDPRCVGVYAEVFAETSESDSAAWHDALASVLFARVECGDSAPEIDQDLAKVEAEDRRRNAPPLIARDHWLRGKLCALRREHVAALEELHAAIEQYRSFQNDDAAVRVGIDAVASMVALEEYAAAIEMSRSIAVWSLRLDQREPSRRRALTAEVTSWLRELAQRHSLTQDVVLEVRDYVTRITNQRPIPFVPPFPLQSV